MMILDKKERTNITHSSLLLRWRIGIEYSMERRGGKSNFTLEKLDQSYFSQVIMVKLS